MYTILGKPNCPWCEKAQELLEVKGLSYSYKNVDPRMNPWLRTLLIMSGKSTVPQVFSPDGSYIGGYEDLVRYLEKN